MAKKQGLIHNLAKRYFIDAMSAMALGLFSSLIIGLILSKISEIPFLSFLEPISKVARSELIVGGAIGAAVAYGLKSRPLTIFSCIVVGAFAYAGDYGSGGPVGAYVAAIFAAEIGNLVAGRTKADIVVVPIVALCVGAIVGGFVGPYIGTGMRWLGQGINSATELSPILMGIVISVSMGMILTLPISSAAIAISLGLDGLAGGAAVVGCAANMIGFAVASFRENGVGGLISQGIGTSMLQMGNIVRRPQIWAPAIVASAVLGPISTAVLKMTCLPEGAGMGTSGLVGQFATYASMTADGASSTYTLITIILMHVVLPAILALGVSEGMRKAGWIKKGDMALKADL